MQDPPNAAEQVVDGQKVRALREQHKLSGRALALRSGLDPTLISRIERGERDTSVKNLVRLADALGVPVDTIIRRPA